MNDGVFFDRIASGENRVTEFKSSLDLEQIGRAACSFLNTDGGTILCGVSDDGRVLGLEGDVGEATHRVELGLKKAISPVPFLTAGIEIVDGARIVVIEVPKGVDGPYVFGGGVWLRSGARTRAAGVDELRALLKVEVAEERWERQVSPLMTEEDLEPDELRATVREARRRGGFPFSDPDDEGLVLKDLMALTSSGFTQGGDVLFSRKPSRRHPQCRAQLLVFPGDKAGALYEDNRSFEGPLVRVCSELVSAVTALIPTRSTFLEGDALRADRPAYDPLAIREGIVNAFVHRDYASYSGGLRISVYGDRIEVWNSGSLPRGIKPKDLSRDHPSILVNPDISHLFYLRGWMERIGRGTEFIAMASRSLGAPAPEWRDTASGVTLTVFSSHSDARRAPNKRQTALLDGLAVDGVISLRDYLAKFGGGITDRQARRDLENLVKAGLLDVEGAGPSTAYRRRRR